MFNVNPPPVMIAIFQPDEVPVDDKGNNDMTLKWGPLGINTALLVPGGDPPHDGDGWNFRATMAGLKVIRGPSGKDPLTNLPDGNLLAITSDVSQDEPDENNVDPAALEQDRDKLLAMYPGVPFYMNFSGGKLLGMEGSTFTDEQYRAMLLHVKYPATDFYPITGWGNASFQMKWRDLGSRLRQLADPTANPEFMAIIEMSGQNLPQAPSGKDGANPAQIAAQVCSALIAGFRHIGYFAIRPPVGGWTFDSSTDLQKSAVKAVNSMILANARFISQGKLVATYNGPKERGQWTLGNQMLTIEVDYTNPDHPTATTGVIGIAGDAGHSTTPTPTTPTTPTPTPLNPNRGKQPITVAWNLKRNFVQVQYQDGVVEVVHDVAKIKRIVDAIHS